MKKVIPILSTLLVIFLMQQSSYGQSGSLKSVTIKCVDLAIETTADISCDTFDQAFGDQEIVKLIFNKEQLSQFQSLMEGFKEVPALRSFNVRGSINFIYGNTKGKYCFNKFGYFYKDGKYYYNKLLLILITDKIFAQHPKYLDTLHQHE